MKQLILVGNQKVKFQDTETIISLTLVSDGNTVTIDSTKTYSVKIKNGTGYVKAINATPDTTNNMVTFSTSGFDGLPVDAYFLELWVIDTNGQTIYPSDSFIELDITANATGVQGQVVPAITLQEFEDRFSTLQSDLEAKVGTLIGPTGATGNGISGVSTQYQLGTDGVNVPTGTWSDTPSTPTDTLPYMWTRNVTTYTDKSTHTSYNISAKGTKGNNFTIQGSTSSIAGLPSTGTDGEGYMVGTELYVWTNGKWNDIVNMKGVQGDQGIQGIQGVKGDTGTGIQSTSTDYELSSQGVEVPNTGWSTTIPVTTNDLPYLWTRVTITFTDSSQHVIYFTSNKGDKGDKGDTGEKGDTGANLSVKGAVDKATDLPSTGNSEGDAYLVGTDLYVYTSGAWKDCGPIVAENTVLYNADGSLNVNGTNYTYVQDLRNGKIQYNDGTKNVQVTPMDADKEASDILAARTYTDTSVSALSTNVDTKLSTKANAADLSTGLATKVTDNKDGTEQLNGTKVQPFNKLSDTIGGRNLLLGTSPVEAWNSTWDNIINVDVTNLVGETLTYSAILDITGSKQGSVGVNLTPQDSSGKSIGDTVFSNSINWGNAGKVIATITIPAGTSNLIINEITNNTDQNPQVGSRKLEQGSVATDWAPAPEDKVNVTDMRKPASDVVGLEDVPQAVVKPALASGVDLNTIVTPGLYPFTGISFTNFIDNGILWGYLVVTSKGDAVTQEFHNAGPGMPFYRTQYGYPASWSPWVRMADDSKVAHLSGANNFNTVPTVNNNPLLLASSLPSDLARTGSNQEFTGKNTFDTAPIDKTTGNPYITKDGVPTVDLSVLAKSTLTADDDVLTLGAGTYWVWGTAPKNYPTSVPWGTVVVKLNPISTTEMNKLVEVTDTSRNRVLNTYSGSPATWSGWQVPNSTRMASKSDLSTGLATKADDSKVVHSTDMRKPASDVAGIEEVNAKQDKIGYTPANDSKVVHSTDMRTPASNVAGIDEVNTKQDKIGYTPADDSKVVHSTDMRKPASDVAGIEEVNAKADNSKVAHLSGANNFDTLPTVNDDPLVTVSQTGDVNKLLTKDKSNYVNSINELASIVDRFYPVASQAIPTDNVSYANQGLVYNYDPSNNTVIFRKNDPSYSINYDTSVVGTNFTENSGGAAPLGGIRIYFGFKAIHYINGTEGTLSDINYYVWNPNDSSTVKSGELGLLKGIPYYLTSENFNVGSNYTIDFSGNGMNLSTSGNNRISPRLIISNKGNGVLNITPYHGEDFKDDKSEGYWIYPYITKMISYSVDTTAMKALPDGYSYDYVKDTSASTTGNYLTAWGQGSYQYKFDLNNLGNGYSIDSMGSSITINVSIKGTDSSYIGYHTGDGYKSSQFPNNTLTTNSGDVDGYADRSSLGKSYINLLLKLSKEDVISGSSYTAYYQVLSSNYGGAVFYAIKLVINNDNTISIYAITPFFTSNTSVFNPSQTVSVSRNYSSSTTISIVNNV